MENEALIAARKGNLEKLKQLLDEGADIHARDDSGLTLLHHAAAHNQHEVLKYLLQNGADILLTTGKNNTVLHIAVTKNDEALVKVILENVARDKVRKLLDAKTKATGTAALHVAAKHNSRAIVSILLEYGANFEIRNNANEKPVDLGTSDELRELFRLIETSFRQAKSGDAKLIDDKLPNDALFSLPVVNCRNDGGHTLMQLIVLGGQTKSKLADKFVRQRVARRWFERDREIESRRLESRRNSDVDEVLERAREQQLFWGKLRADDGGGGGRARCDRKAYLALGMSHEVLLAYRKMVEYDETPTVNVAVKVIEEVFEVLGFDPDKRLVVVGDKDCYYNKLPFLWKIDAFSFELLMNGVIHFAIGILLIEIKDLQIFRAVKDNDAARVQQLLLSDTYHEVPDREKRTLLSYAVENGNEDIVKLLLQPGATLTFGCGILFSLFMAVGRGHAKIVQMILSKVDPKVMAETIDARLNKKFSVLHVAAKVGRLDIVKMLLRHGAKYSVLDEEDRTPADVSTSEEVTRFLGLVDEYFREAKNGDAQLIRKLEWMPCRDFLAVAATRNLRGETLAEVATKAGVKSIAETILRMISATDSEGLIAVRKGDLPKLKQLLDQDLDIDAQDADGRTLLHHAASRGHREIVECLLQKGADVLLTTDKHNTVLHVAVMKNDETLVKVILENVARNKLSKLIDARTKATGTAVLHVAAKQNSHAIISILLEYGANFEISNNAGEKPVDLATTQRFRELYRLVESSFAKAKKSECKVKDEFEPIFHDLLPMVNCRDNEGHTLLQVFIQHASKYKQPSDMPGYQFLSLRVDESIPRDPRNMLEPNRRSDLDKMAELARECQKLWEARQQYILTHVRSRKQHGRVASDVFVCMADEEACFALDKTRELLLTYRKADGPLTVNASMKSLEELFEAMGFDLEQRHAVASLMERYYRKLTIKLNEDALSISLFLLCMYCLICKCIEGFIDNLNFALLFSAVKDNDISKVQQLIDSDFCADTNICDENGRTMMCCAVENGSTKMVKFLLKSGTLAACACLPKCGALLPLHLAVSKGHAKIVKLLLKKADAESLAKIMDYRREHQGTALHVAAKSGCLDLVQMLLKYGAPYGISDAKGRSPLDVSTNEEVTDFLRLVDNCFRDAKKANSELVYKLKAMSSDMFQAVAGTKDSNGQTLSVVSSKANAKSISVIILRMIREVRETKK